MVVTGLELSFYITLLRIALIYQFFFLSIFGWLLFLSASLYHSLHWFFFFAIYQQQQHKYTQQSCRVYCLINSFLFHFSSFSSVWFYTFLFEFSQRKPTISFTTRSSSSQLHFSLSLSLSLLLSISFTLVNISRMFLSVWYTYTVWCRRIYAFVDRHTVCFFAHRLFQSYWLIMW